MLKNKAFKSITKKNMPNSIELTKY
jgi:hypothetical protein